MLTQVLRNTEWSQLSAFVTPAFFDVMPTRRLLARASQLVTTRSSRRYEEALAALAASVQASELEQARVVGRGADAALLLSGGARDPAAERARRVVSLYFHQLFHDGPCFLDLRSAAFAASGGDLAYRPSPWLVAWDGEFLRGLRRVYVGFYAHDDASFSEGLEALGIAPCADLFRAHFGGDAAEHTFHTRDFVATFHHVFVRCRDLGLTLHADFLPLGIYLAALYEHLETLSVPVDVRAAFLRATRDRC